MGVICASLRQAPRLAMACSVALGVAIGCPQTSHAGGTVEVGVWRLIDDRPDRPFLYRSSDAAAAYDAVRGTTVVFGGAVHRAVNGDTLVFDGGTWTAPEPSVHPEARSGHAMVFDASRGKTVLFGGGNRVDLFADTWEWDGTSWTKLELATAPPARYGHAMAYDPTGPRIVLFGGHNGVAVLDDTWVLDSNGWQELDPPQAPAARRSHAMAFFESATEGVVLLFGGVVGASGYLGDTWVLDGSTWEDVTPLALAPSPPPRALHGMAHDNLRKGGGVVVLSHGDGAEIYDDTWEWDGDVWEEVTPATVPRRFGFSAGLVFDSGRGVTLALGPGAPLQWNGEEWTRLPCAASGPPIFGMAVEVDATGDVIGFGGLDNCGQLSAQTWRWNDPGWELLDVAGPAATVAAALARDASTGRVVLFDEGGATWEWTGSEWQSFSPPAESPSPRFWAAMAYDEGTEKKTILFGGHGGATCFDDTWAWDGADWSQPKTALRPAPRCGHTMSWDGVGILLFGGGSDTWRWGADGWTLLDPETSPALRYFPALGFDPETERTVLFGGYGPFGMFDDTWEWRDDEWARVATPLTDGPPAMAIATMLYHPGRSRLLLFGGSGGATSYGDVWEYEHLLVDGQPCADAGSCLSGFCTDGLCCEVDACGRGEVCGTAGTCEVTPASGCGCRVAGVPAGTRFYAGGALVGFLLLSFVLALTARRGGRG